MNPKYTISAPEDVLNTVGRLGFLPFFSNSIPGFSIEEMCRPSLWFGQEEGPWEWKGPVIRMGGVIYGKFLAGKACYISKEWIPDFLNYRRDGYDFDSRYESGLAGRRDLNIYDAVTRYGSILSKKLKSLCGYTKAGGEKGFDGIITRLQMQGYICISDFEYMIDKHGNRYGWGVARYSTPEKMFGYELCSSAYSREPSESFERIIEHVSSVCPNASEDSIRKLFRYR